MCKNGDHKIDYKSDPQIAARVSITTTLMILGAQFDHCQANLGVTFLDQFWYRKVTQVTAVARARRKVQRLRSKSFLFEPERPVISQ